MKFQKLLILSLVFLGLSACTDLKEDLNDSLTLEQSLALSNPASILQSTYESFRTPYLGQDNNFALQTMSGDEAMGPTRGPDWDDGGVWRAMHNHTWAPTASRPSDTFNGILQIVFNASDVLNFSPSAQQAAEARFLRAFAMFSMADLWGQVPVRVVGTSSEDLLNPSLVLTSQEAVDFIIAEVTEIMDDLPDGPAYVANKDAAKVLLMKTYLNRGTFADKINPKFDDADMQIVSDLADDIIGSGKYSIQDNFFDNFIPDNGETSTELIFTLQNIRGVSGGNVRHMYHSGLHYNQNPAGWNGFCTLGDFYDSFEANDDRLGMAYPGITDVGGVRVGFLEGQQFDGDGNALEDRKGNPLVFSKEVALTESDPNTLERTGIRVAKYAVDYFIDSDLTEHDWVFYRYSDVLLMKAEALLRLNQESEARTIVNSIRAKRGVADFTTLDLDNLLAERGRELYWEGHRRTDLIRFGKFLDAWHEKPASGTERLLFPIPESQLAVNPNLTQNPGY